MAKSLAQSLSGSTSVNLKRLGYFVDYSDTLSSLYNPVAKSSSQIEGMSKTAEMGRATGADEYKSLLGEGSITGEVVNGFVTDTKSQQAICTLKAWLAFPITDEGEEFNVSVGMPDGENGILSGNTLCGNNTTIPDKVSKADKSIGEGNDEFVIGVGLDLAKFGGTYFKHFYGNVGWDNLDDVITKLPVLAGKKLLYAEITLDIDGGKLLNAPVVISTNDCPSGSGAAVYRLWMPCPLILLQDYSALGTIIIKDKSGKNAKCGDGSLIFPFRSSGYDHKNARIKGLKKSHYGNIVGKESNSANLQYVGVNWNIASSEADKKVRVRLYFDEDRRTEVEEVIGAVPKSAERVFGPLEIIERSTLIDTSSAFNYDGNIDYYFEEGKYSNLTKEVYIKALRLISCYEIGSSEPIPSRIEVVRGESWPSYGTYQAIERGTNKGISQILKYYEQICKESGNAYDEETLRVAKRIAQGSRKGSPEFNALETLGKDPRMAYAQSMHVWKTKIKNAMELYESLGFQSAFGVYYCVDCVNNGYKKSYFLNNSNVKNATSEQQRIEAAINLRESYLRSLKFSEPKIKNGVAYIYKWDYYGGWRTKMKEWRANTADGNFNLTMPKKWNGVICPKA